MSNQLELRHFRYFLAVAQELHFRRAAEQMYLSQPALSRQIKQLEELLEVKLFDRHNRKVSLTPAGAYLAGELEDWLGQMDQLLLHTQMLARGVKGRLRLGYIGSAVQNIIPEFLLRIKKDYADVQFRLREMDNQQQVDALLRGDIDLGFVRLDRLPRPLEMRPVYKDTFSLVLPASHPLNQATFHSLNQVKDEPFILFEKEYSFSYFEKVMQLFDEVGLTPIVAHYTVQANTIYRLVANGLGISIVPSVLQHGYDMDIKFIELNQTSIRTTLQVAWHRKNNNPVMVHILDYLPDQL
jgi:DNA-binding transcriptional LysR family regulator